MKGLLGLLIATTLESGCAKTDWIDRTLVTVDVTGVWIGSAGEGKSTFPVQFDLEQAGSKVKGAARLQGSGAGRAGPDVSGSIEGTVEGDVFHFTGSRGKWAGTLTVSGDKMEGPGTAGAMPGQLTLRRVDPPSPPGSPPR
jgi:hypothetical protein